MPKNEYLDPDYQKKYRSSSEHKERQQKYKETLRQKKKDLLVEHIGDCCALCGSNDRMELDHINPAHKPKVLEHRGLNGSIKEMKKQLSIDNLRWLCYDCHKQRTSLQLRAAWNLFITLPLEQQEQLISKL